jgi:iron-sulfur cluster insertion protein
VRNCHNASATRILDNLFNGKLPQEQPMSAIAEQVQSENPHPMAGHDGPPVPLVFTDSAANKVKELVDEEGNPELKLRVFVQGGGCSGFQYGFTFDEIVNDDDTQMSKNGVTLLIDAMSLQYLAGAEIDYKDDLQGAQFVIKNPNATTTCGCGSSFSA